MSKLTLTFEFNSVEELEATLAKLKGETTQVHTTAQAEPLSAEGLSPKQKLIKEAEAMGIKVAAKDTIGDIQDKINQANGVAQETVAAPANVPNVAQPQVAQPQVAQPQVIPPVFAQQPAPIPAPIAAPVTSLTEDKRKEIIGDISASLAKLSTAGVPEGQIMPLVHVEYAAIGAPINQRISQLSDAHLLAIYPKVMNVFEGILQGKQPSSFV